MPTPLVVANWKMHTTLQEARELALAVRKALAGGPQGVEVVLCPPFPYLALVREALQGSALRVGAQNMHYEAKGAFTGEVSPAMVAELCQFVILGHSERRQRFHESDETVQRKAKTAMAYGLRPILCVGETSEERQAGEAEAVVARQLRAALEGLPEPAGLAVAYEPVWAIGTGVAATPETAQEVMGGVILPALAGLFGEHEALDVPLLYGGSVSTANVEGFAAQPAVHGALVGGASLRASEFAEIVRATARAKGLL
jgi:triosephosphate isomerase